MNRGDSGARGRGGVRRWEGSSAHSVLHAKLSGLAARPSRFVARAATTLHAGSGWRGKAFDAPRSTRSLADPFPGVHHHAPLLLRKIIGSKNEREVRKLPAGYHINELEQLVSLSDEELRQGHRRAEL